QRELALVQIPKGGIGAMLASLPQGSRLTRQAGSRSHDVFCAVVEQSAGELLGRQNVPEPAGDLLSSDPRTFGPTTGITRDGWVVATMHAGIRRIAVAWTDSGTRILRMSDGPGFLLPGP